MTRDHLLSVLADRISRVARAHPVRVAVDGVDAAGKTTLADELVAPLEGRGRPVIRASADGFHFPADVRYGQGRLSPEGYYRDSFNWPALVVALLNPLGPAGDRRYRRAVFDFRLDGPVNEPVHEASADAVLLFDGVFLLVPQLRPYWDYAIFVRAAFETTVARAEIRDGALFGGAPQTRQRYLERYIPGQRLYLAEVHPEWHADVIVDNDDPDRPTLADGRNPS